jgi:nitrite reductase (NADH) small subunit
MAKTTKQVEVGAVDEFSVGQFRIVEIDGREIGVTRLANGEFRAVRNYCPHKGAPVCKGIVGGTWLPCAPGEMKFGMDGQVLVCPWHGYEFSLDDGVELFQKDPSKLLMFPATVANGRVVVTV